MNLTPYGHISTTKISELCPRSPRKAKASGQCCAWESGFAFHALNQPLLEGQEESLSGNGRLGPYVWTSRPLALYSSASPLSQFVVNCNSIQSLPTITFVISGTPLPLPPSTYVLNVRMHPRLQGNGIGWVQTAVPCPRCSHLSTYGESAVAGLRVNKNPETPQVSWNIGWDVPVGKGPSCTWLYPHVLCLCRTMATAPLGLKSLTCPPPMDSPCGFWEMSSSKNITLSTTWGTTGWVLPSLSRTARGSCLLLPSRILGLPCWFSGLTAAF